MRDFISELAPALALDRPTTESALRLLYDVIRSSVPPGAYQTLCLQDPGIDKILNICRQRRMGVHTFAGPAPSDREMLRDGFQRLGVDEYQARLLIGCVLSRLRERISGAELSSWLSRLPALDLRAWVLPSPFLA